MKRLAFLVDAENANPAHLADVLEAASAHGNPVVRRSYATFAAETTKGWRSSPYAALGITPVHVPSVTKGKNAADIALAVDAMELALDARAEAVCIVSSDGDFSMLAHRLRERGVFVIGAGDGRSAAGWRGACDVFVELPGGCLPEDSIHNRERLITELRTILSGGPARLSDLGTALRTVDPGFTPRRFGKSKLSKLVATLPGMAVEETDGDHYAVLRPALRIVQVPDVSAPEVAAAASGH